MPSPEFHDGYDAAMDDMESDENVSPNPYPEHTAQCDAWTAGYSAGLDEIERHDPFEEDLDDELDEDGRLLDDFDEDDDPNEVHAQAVVDEMYDDAYEEGREAYLGGGQPRNPYDDDITRGAEWSGWEDGWQDAMQDAEQEG